MTTALDSSFFEFFKFWIWTNHNSLLSIATNQFHFVWTLDHVSAIFVSVKSREIWNKKAFFPDILIFLFFKTHRFQVAVPLFSNRSQGTSKCGKNISDTLGCTSCATFLFLTDARQHGFYLLNRWHLKHSGSPFKLHTNSCVWVLNADAKFIYLRLNVIF